MKTKPTQASVKELQGMGIQPDIIVCRSEYPIDKQMRDKISLFCNIPSNHVLQNLDVEYLFIKNSFIPKKPEMASGFYLTNL